ncbi:MAG: hypothetical protein J6036_02480 [Clostridia bacterium]|nr:hypothetical protein [Clostridia bacterium]
MIITVSENAAAFDRMSDVLQAIGLFSVRSGYTAAAKTAKEFGATLAVIFSTSKTETEANSACRAIKNAVGDIPIISICDISSDIGERRFKNVPESTSELTLPCSDGDITDLLERYVKTDFDIGDLHIGKSRDDVYLLGYKLSLTPTEHKILRLVAELSPTRLQMKSIRVFIPQLNVSPNCVSAHISKINEKAVRISGRRLVGFKNGYYFL